MHLAYKKILDIMLAIINKMHIFEIYIRLVSLIHPILIIIMYHRVGPFKDLWSLKPIDQVIFEDQINYLKNNYSIISFDSLISSLENNKPLPRRAAIITFDDGYKDVYECAYPILKKYNLSATIFLSTGHIETGILFWTDKLRYILLKTKEQSFNWDYANEIQLSSLADKSKAIQKIISSLKRKPNLEKEIILNDLERILNVEIPSDLANESILTWKEIIEMSLNGIDFGAHTVTHPILTSVSVGQAKFEIEKSKEDIENKIHRPVITFCYPFGQAEDYNQLLINVLKKSGFKCAVTAIDGVANPEKGLFELNRISPGYDLDSFKFFSSGVMLWPNILMPIKK
jgi:peptidoglycan/xylan/chitin deacetylase (PgdA/CDA1 family)